MTPEGSCPTCNRPLDAPESSGGADHADDGAPGHFKLLIVAVVVYLVWRAYQLIAG